MEGRGIFRIALASAAALIALAPAASAQNSDETHLIEGCHWQDQTVVLNGKAEQQLSFRWQECDGKNAPEVSFSLDERNRLIMHGDAEPQPVAQFWSLAGKRPSQVIPSIAEPSVSPEEKGRCLAHLDMVTGQYSYEPAVALMEDYLAREEPFSACGDYGATNDSIQYFTVLDKAILALFWVGQDTPLFDPASFKYVNTKTPGVAE